VSDPSAAPALPNIPPAPAIPGFTHVYSGKVRDLYRDADGALLFVASDRISAFDWVLPTTIPDKGAILTQLSLWWFERVADLVGNHVLSTDVPAAVAGRAMLCRPLAMLPVECVARGYLSGSGLAEYRASGAVCGVPLPDGLVDGSRLPEPIFTPATKAALGTHDENVDFAAVVRTVGTADAEALRRLTLAVYARAEGIARERGIILADTKVEFGRPAEDLAAPILLGDEVLTPDSSRFWPADQWQPGRPGGQPSYDKQFVRDWLDSPASGWDRTGPTPPPPLPDDVVERTRALYVHAYEQLTARRWT
jgi:phosphoribosylaminoimidazole-succinocarboxamide synthase